MTSSFARFSALFLSATFVAVVSAMAAEPSSRPAAPDYPVPYRRPTVDGITRTLRSVKSQIEASAATTLTTRPSSNRSDRKFRLISYPMGVVYSGMLAAADATGDKSFADFDAARFQMFADAIAKLDKTQIERHHSEITYLINPISLDNCGAIGAALVKARRGKIGPDLQSAIDDIARYISHGQLRLDDGTLARAMPFKNSVWADDAYMSIPFLAQMGALSGDEKYFDDAAAQMLHFSSYLLVPSTGLFTHHWNTGNPDDQPRYYWGRGNGWCAMAMVELLDVLPQDHPQRARILRLFRAYAQAVASLQAGDGLWHQMLDRTDSYTETSCSAMFTFALARGVNRGWLDASAYGPVAQAGWNGLTSRIDDEGHITGTCVGTGYADDYVFYYHRPQTDDIHGYGPVLLAGAEMIHLLKNDHLRIRSPERGSPVMYYQKRN
ncbi:MAG TPA: glycoside hydrolase family 88 protein [Tepidisphaeraceae bacterium]|jgi:rhamnogalacturonyl hydrolase YesR|nr:glycoside hydrolase family 88 protein [Tepidisphaeraceae bacterium]